MPGINVTWSPLPGPPISMQDRLKALQQGQNLLAEKRAQFQAYTQALTSAEQTIQKAMVQVKADAKAKGITLTPSQALAQARTQTQSLVNQGFKSFSA